jgi:hypothetical protein
MPANNYVLIHHVFSFLYLYHNTHSTCIIVKVFLLIFPTPYTEIVLYELLWEPCNLLIMPGSEQMLYNVLWMNNGYKSIRMTPCSRFVNSPTGEMVNNKHLIIYRW